MELMGSLPACAAGSASLTAKRSMPIGALRTARSGALPIFKQSFANTAPSRQARRASQLCRAEIAGNAVEATTQAIIQKGAPKSEVWELDFCSRPMVDERGKKVWELLICDPERNFEYAQYFPNNKINSGEVSS